MKNIRYMIHTLSAKAIMSFSRENKDESYSFQLSQNETDKCKLNRNYLLQDDMPICFQAMCVLKGNEYKYGKPFQDDEALLDILVYIDFSGIFDRYSQQKKYIDRQKKAESMFRPEGIYLDFGKGAHRYLAFERSGSMSRAAKISFVREDFYEPLRHRMMLDMHIGKCQLSKLYAYNGLMFTSGHRYEDMSIWDGKRVVVVDNPKSLVYEANIVTVKDDGSDKSMRKYTRVEDVADIEILEFDGEGLISPSLADKIDTDYCGQYIHSSFQIRMPYIKGVVHEVDFKSMLSELGVPYIIDLWGNKHKVRDVDLILTKSMFKGCGWMTENGLTFDEYLARCRKYRHALYISGVNQTDKQEYTELNYQFLNTVSMKAEEFRPLDLPDGWKYSPETDSRHWITKATETQYYDYVANNKYRVQYFIDALDSFESSDKQKQLARIVQKNHLFVNEPIYTAELDSKAKKALQKYALGRLVISGDNRYLSGDLMRFIQSLVKTVSEVDDKYMGVVARIGQECSSQAVAYAPGAAYPEGDKYTLLRNPHIARNEEAVVSPIEQVGYLRNKYLSHLNYVVMVDSRTLIPERLGGADFDGDMVKTIADPLLNECVTRNYRDDDFDPFSHQSNIPLLKIPSAAPIVRDANDWQARFEAVKSTFSSRIGQICNAAFDRSIIAYDENSTAAERNRCREETETLAILVGLEIDSAKSGIKPDLTEYLSQKTVGRSIFLKYKNLMNDGDEHEWYEKTLKQKLDAYHDSVNWDEISSNVERLPYLSRMLEQNTPKIKPTPASDKELFTFAEKEGWKDAIPKEDMDYMRALIADYEEILKRARHLNIERKTMTHRSDIERILYARGQENTFTTLTDFEGMARILTILARGYLFHDADGNILDEKPKERIELARCALLAWCSIPDTKKATPKEEWQYRTDFRKYSGEFPALVDDNGGGWFYRHVHGVIDFVRDNPALVSKPAQSNCEALATGFDKEWRNKVKQFQTPIFSRSTKGAWVLRFDDILADSLELGALRKDEISLTHEEIETVAALTPKDIPNEVIHTLIAYYRANKPEDSDWVVLPVASFDAYFGSTNFSHKWLVKIPDTILTREKQSFGVCRYKENI